MISSDPFPMVMHSGGRFAWAARAFFSANAAPSGYRFIAPRASLIAATAFGDGPRAFSLEPSLITSSRPYSRLVSSIGFPGEYGTRRLTAGLGCRGVLGMVA